MIAIIGAMSSEVEFYKTVMSNLQEKKINNHDFYLGTIGKSEICLTKCGIGKVSSSIVTSLLINNFNPKLIINTGIAGGVSPLCTNDIFIASNYIYGDFILPEYFGYENHQVPGYPQYYNSSNHYTNLIKDYFNNKSILFKDGTIVTQDSFITSMNQLDSYDVNIATDMEGASIAHTCFFHNIEFFSIRIISDVIGSSNQIDNYAVFEDEAAKISSQVTYEFLKSL